MLLFCAVLRSLISKRFLLAGHSGKSSFFVDGYLVGKAETVPNVLTAIGSAINLSCLPSTVSTPLILSHFGAYRQAMTPEQVQTLSTWREAAVDPYVQVSFFFTVFFSYRTKLQDKDKLYCHLLEELTHYISSLSWLAVVQLLKFHVCCSLWCNWLPASMMARKLQSMNQP